jgi:hypothetical protein
MESEKTDDHQHLLDSVRDAMSQHNSEADSSHQPIEPAQEHHEAEHGENSQAATEMGLQVAALMNQEERQRAGDSRQARDGRGRFTSTVATESATPDAALNVAATAAAPPTSWDIAAKAEWDRLPPHVQQAIAKREAEVSSGFSQYRDRTQAAAQIEQMMAPRRQTFQQYGMKSDAEAIERLLLVSDGMSRNPSGTLAFLAQQFGVAPHQVFPNVQSGPSQEQVEQYVQQRVQMAQAQAEVQRFESKAPEHYGLVKSVMGQLLQSGKASTMADAYKQAIAQHPAVVSIEGQRKDRERRDRQIRAANASLSGAPHGVSATPPRSNGQADGKFSDIADDVRAAMASLV